MPAVKSLSESSKKWVERAGQAASAYKSGVQNPKRSWAQSTAAAADAQAAGVTQAISDKRFEKGVAKAGDEKWKTGAVQKGATRYGPGVSVAKGDYEKGFGPYVSVIEGVSLPPRGPAGDPRNYERSKAIGEALNKAKTGAS